MFDQESHISILVVDDNDLGRFTMLALLEALNIKAIEADNGKKAIECATTEHIDLILMDIQMPIMDGITTTRILREMALTTPIIAMTAHSLEDLNGEFNQAGFTTYLQKPIEIDNLYTALKQWLPPSCQPLITAPPLLKNPPPSNPPFTVAGIDVESGLRRAAGKQSLYNKHLKSVVADFSDFETKILKKLSAGQQSEAIRLTHTLKGIAGNLGAGELYTLASALEKALLKPSYQDDLSKTSQEITRLCNIISTLDLEASVVELNLPVGTNHILSRILPQFIEPLENLQVNKINQLRDQLQRFQWTDKLSEPMITLNQQLKSYQYQAAVKHVKSLLATTGNPDA